MGLPSDLIRRGTRAAQPAATAVAAGTLYYVTDEATTERSSGAAWQTYGDGATPPVVLIDEQSPSGVSTITFSAIAATYRDLKCVVRGAGLKAASFVAVRFRFNGDTGSNYDFQANTFNNATATSAGQVAQAFIENGFLPAASGVSSAGGEAELTIYNYRDTTFHKACMGTSGVRLSGAASGLFNTQTWADWRNTAAITSVTAFLESGNFAAGSVVSLYGLR